MIDFTARPIKLFLNSDCMDAMKEIPDKIDFHIDIVNTYSI